MDEACDVVVVGAGGWRGLAAAGALRKAGLRCTVIEAAGAESAAGPGPPCRPCSAARRSTTGRPGCTPPAATRSPALARARHEALIDTDAVRVRVMRRDGRPASPADDVAYAAALANFERLTAEQLAGPDISLAEAVAPAAAQPWMASVGQLGGADHRRRRCAGRSACGIGHVNALEGQNLEVAGGLGAFVHRALGPSAGPVHVGVAASAIAWDGAGVAVQTARGTIRAAACIVTVSTGVLAADAIAFTPGLPEPVQAAIAGLPMGVLNKVAAAGGGRGPAGPAEFLQRQPVRRPDRRPGDDLRRVAAWAGPSDRLHGRQRGGGAGPGGRRGGPCQGATAQRVRGGGGGRLRARRRGDALGVRPARPRVLRLCQARPRGAHGRCWRNRSPAGGWCLPARPPARMGLAGTVGGGAYLSGVAAARDRHSMRCRMIFWMSLVPS